VVDNFSTDGTFEAARRLADLALQAGPERSAQRNLGFARSRGEYVLFIDSDMELRPGTVERAMAEMLGADATAVIIPEVSVGRGYWASCRALERRCYDEEGLIENPRLFRRSFFQGAGGFVEWLSGTEDSELRWRLRDAGEPIARAATLIVHHEGRLSLGHTLRERFYYGRGLRRYRRAHPGAVSRQAGAATRAFFRNWRLLLERPHLAVGIVVMRSLEVAAYVAGALAGPRAGT
jgi:glycosyltransferase involved in cell wall biosynthesis